MKLALLVGANPRSSTGGPRVKLGAGKWRIDSDAKESTFFPAVDTLLTGPTDVTMRFIKRGTESHISVYAEQVSDGT